MRQQIEKGNDAWLKYNVRAEHAREAGQQEMELAILEQAVAAGVDTPGTYERLAVLLGKRNEYTRAYEVCQKWFSTDYWKIPNAATTSLKLLERMEKLKTRLDG
jgi:Tfp pilus assembly protein PilF